LARRGRTRGRGRGRTASQPGPQGRERFGRDRERSESFARPRPKISELCELSPFSVFCALYLGITETDGYADQPRRQVAERFGLSDEDLEAYLGEHRLCADDLESADFDLEGARIDIKVAPEGISRTELARTLFEELCGQEG
jgi:hypothetical protein